MSTFVNRVARVFLVCVLLGIVSASQVAASPGRLQEEPTARPSPTPAPLLELTPNQALAGTAVLVTASGQLWVPGLPVLIYWQAGETPVAETLVAADGTFAVEFGTPTVAEGVYLVTAEQVQNEVVILSVQAKFQFIPLTPTFTPTATGSPTPTPSPSLTPTGSPTFTPSPTLTPSPSPTLRPVTPMVTITPIPPTRGPTRAPLATRTNTPVPGTPTNTLTPSVTPKPTDTPGPGTPSVTPEPTATPVKEIVDTGGGWGALFLWGFVLAGLVVVFRLLRVRSLAG